MSKSTYVYRYNLIMNRIKQSSCSFKEIETYVNKKFNQLEDRGKDLTYAFSKRTFFRDIKEIKEIFGVDIEYNPQLKGYTIDESKIDHNGFEQRLESFEICNSLNYSNNLSDYIYLEKKSYLNNANIFDVLHAIKNKKIIKLAHEKYEVGENIITDYLCEPIALKEYRRRWYVIAKDIEDGLVKVFPHDRIIHFEITNKNFKQSAKIDINEMFKYSHGVMIPSKGKPKKIVLSFNAWQGQWIKSLPLNHTQKIILDNEEELRVELNIYITIDFIMDLRSYAHTVKVLQPRSLVKMLQKDFKKALEEYN